MFTYSDKGFALVSLPQCAFFVGVVGFTYKEHVGLTGVKFVLKDKNKVVNKQQRSSK